MQESSLKRLSRFVFTYWPFLLLSTFAALFYVVFNSASVWVTATMINNILIDFNDMLVDNKRLLSLNELSMNDRLKLYSNSILLKDTAIDTVSTVCAALIFIFAAKNISLYIKNISLSVVQYKLIRDLRNRLYAHFHHLSLSYFNKNKSGKLTSVLVSDVDNIKNSLTQIFQKLFVEPLNIVFLISLLFIISKKLAVIALLIIPISGLIIFSVASSIRRRAERGQAQLAGITSIITETISSIRIVKAFATKFFEINRFAKETQKYYKLMLRKDRLSFISSPISETLAASIASVLLWVGARDVLVNQSITSEDFLRFILLLFSLFRPLKSLGNVVNQLQNGLASADRIFAIMDTKSDINDIENPYNISDLNEKISFNNVSFSYEKNDKKVLDNISFEIKKGEVIALVGPSGAGKSTLVDLLPRFYDASGGSIEIDNKNLKEIKLNSLRSLMGIVTQETLLFDDSIRGNIAYGAETVSDKKIEKAAIAANAHEFILNLPDGYNTIIGENGVSLSGGQKQRIAIARAIVNNPPILILDEATSSLDSESEKHVQLAIENLMNERTVVVIAHRLSTVHNANKILVIDDGKIVQKGNHKELVSTNGLYKELHKMQFQT